MKAVHVLVRVDPLNDVQRIDMSGQGQLHENAVNARVVVAAVNQRQQFLLARIRRKVVIDRRYSCVCAGGTLVSNIDMRSRVLSDQHRGKRRRSKPRVKPLLHRLPNLFPNLRRNGLAVNQLCGHEWVVSLWRGWWQRSGFPFFMNA